MTSDEAAEHGERLIYYDSNIENDNTLNNGYYEIIWGIESDSIEELYEFITEGLDEYRVYANNNMPTNWFRISLEELINYMTTSNRIGSHIISTFTNIPRMVTTTH